MEWQELKEAVDCACKEAFEEEEQGRAYLGASLLGHECDRYIWLSYRQAVKEEKDGRLYRLFDRGTREEAAFKRWLEMTGAKVRHTGKKQLWLQLSPHVGGHPDGLISGGEFFKTPHVVEFKTHNKNSFQTLVRQGLQTAKPRHWAQMQAYMLGLQGTKGAPAAGLYAAVNKDNDELYFERVPFEREEAQKLIERAERLATMERAPVQLCGNAAGFPCRLCSFKTFCYGTAEEKKTLLRDHCLTCAFYDPLEGCTNGQAKGERKQGEDFDCYAPHQDLTDWFFSRAEPSDRRSGLSDRRSGKGGRAGMGAVARH